MIGGLVRSLLAPGGTPAAPADTLALVLPHLAAMRLYADQALEIPDDVKRAFANLCDALERWQKAEPAAVSA